MPSSDCSIKYSNLNAVLVFTILSNSVKGCIIDLKKKNKKFYTFDLHPMDVLLWLQKQLL